MTTRYESVMQILQYLRVLETDITEEEFKEMKLYLKTEKFTEVAGSQFMTARQRECWYERNYGTGSVINGTKEFPGDMIPFREFEAAQAARITQSSAIAQNAPGGAGNGLSNTDETSVAIDAAQSATQAGTAVANVASGMASSSISKFPPVTIPKPIAQYSAVAQHAAHWPDPAAVEAEVKRMAESYHNGLVQENSKAAYERIHCQMVNAAKRNPDPNGRVRAERLALHEVDPLKDGSHTNVVTFSRSEEVENAFKGRPADEEIRFVEKQLGLKVSSNHDNFVFRVWVQANAAACVDFKEKEKAKLAFGFGFLKFWKPRVEDDREAGRVLTSFKQACEWFCVPQNPMFTPWLGATENVKMEILTDADRAAEY
ncbi:hypothetical protein EG329_008541 [Mollisiaceae sp. DMI_Dod_QoI]|nr:hypothetical protein EG329_008541 [Helotiales sp. DMI_Dod_QoI]